MARSLSPRAAVAAALLAGSLGASAGAQQAPAPVVGRWDLTVEGPGGRYPSWLEVSPSGYRTLVGRFVGGSGSARPVERVVEQDGVYRFAIPPQWEQGTGDLRVEARVRNDSLVGTLTTPAGERHALRGVRAPALTRPASGSWGEPMVLFNGRDLAGWTAFGGDGVNRWVVEDGVLRNTGSGANLRTDRTFDDFNLRLEFRYPANGNSGVYLRGRHEVQVEDSGMREPTPVSLGGVYGFLAANQAPMTRPGEWNAYDITLRGRRVTVVLNGKTIIADAVIPGITGGALDSDEGAPGPIYLQGDHTGVEFRNIVLTPIR